MTYVLLFISLATGQPLTGDNAVLVFKTQDQCVTAGQTFLQALPEVRARFTYECIPAQKAA